LLTYWCAGLGSAIRDGFLSVSISIAGWQSFWAAA
jgi:hypothetical protein